MLVSADLGVAFATPGVRRLWPEITFRPIQSPAFMEQGNAYNRAARTPVLEIFLRAVRQSLRKKKP